MRTEDDVNLQQSADAAASRLTAFRAELIKPLGSDDATFRDLDGLTVTAMEAGLYSIAVFFHDRIWRARLDRKESGKALESYEHQLSAQAGIRGAQATNLTSDNRVAPRPRTLLYLAVNQSNAGHMHAAQISLEQAKDWLKKPVHAGEREGLELDVLLREAGVIRSRPSAERAVKVAAQMGSVYREHTARVYAGMIALADDTPASREASRDHFDAILSSRQGASWLYRAECWFGLKYLALISKPRRLEASYRYLIAAQYVYGLLAVQPLPHIGLRLPSAPEPVCLPSHLLRTPQFGELTPARCKHLRCLAIIRSGIRNSILWDLRGGGLPRSGDQAGPDPLAPFSAVREGKVCLCWPGWLDL